MSKEVVGIVGSYRKGHIIDSAVSAVLKGAEEGGAATKMIYLTDKHIEFCTNCRTCTQEKDVSRGKCVHEDDMEEILKEIKMADGVVLGSPINFFTVTAVMKEFVERLVGFAYWPWGRGAPRLRTKKPSKKAVIITSSACPAFIGRILMPNALSVMKAAAQTMGAKVVRKLYFGLVAGKKDQRLNEKALRKAREAGRTLVS
ncbi:MAG: flavodoxin family protein [Planctomycetota bacterium]|jgi:FMN-dependent NADH-azoreductase